jgi:hypothetical protein
MGLLRGVHVEAHLLHDVGDVGPGEGQVLEGVGQAPVGCRVYDRGGGGGRRPQRASLECRWA